MGTITLVVRRRIRATPQRLFDAWTDPAQVTLWWGPRDVECIGAEIELRVGGRYRFGSRLPDGRVLWIAGEFEAIERPRRLVFTWRLEPEPHAVERVTVRFEPSGDATEVVVSHERIASAATRDQHEQGWRGCLEGLAEHVEPPRLEPG